MKFCLDDGAVLIENSAPTRPAASAEATLNMPAPTQRVAGERSTQPSTMTAFGAPQSPAVGGYAVADNRPRSSALLWVVVALIVGGSGIAVALILTRSKSESSVSANMATPTPAMSAATRGADSASTPVVGSESMSSPAAAKPTVAQPAAAMKSQTEMTARASNTAPPTVSEPAKEPPPPKTISGGVLNGKAISLPKPAYPAIARSANASGPVQVQVLVDEQGRVVSAHAISGHPLLQSAAVAAARSATFSPTILNGQPVKVNGIITYNFQLQ